VLPRSGVPPSFADWDDFARYVAWGWRGGLFPDATHLWWDLRPHPGHGTLELRVADAQTYLVDTAAIAAVAQSLAAHLAELWDTGEPLAVHPTHRIRENAWRALRYGVRGFLVDLDTGTAMPTRERLLGLIQRLRASARRLGCDDELLDASALVAGNGADRQRYVAEREGLSGLVRWLADETERVLA
jgi:carboxylate-amine ligase